MDFLVKSFNINGWAYKLSYMSYGSRLDMIINKITDESYLDNKVLVGIIALQEVIIGKNGKYKKQIESNLPDYEVILPKGYEEKNFKSAVNVLLVHRSLIECIEILSLNDIDSYLYNYVLIKTNDGAALRILNIHLPNLSLDNAAYWYAMSRKKLSLRFWNSIIEEIEKNKEQEHFYVVGDFNSTLDDEVMKRICYGNMVNITQKADTYINTMKGVQSQIDYIFVSLPTIACKNNTVRTAVVDRNIIDEKISDHCMLTSWISLNATA